LGFRKAITTVRNSSTQIIATIAIRCAGTYSLEVENPQPGGGLSAPAALNVPSATTLTTLTALVTVTDPAPVITSIDGGNVTWNPNSPPNAAFNQPVVINGTNFAPNAVAWVNPPCDSLGLRKALSTVRNSSTQVIATIPIRCAGTYSLQVENPQPGGGLSAPASLVVPSVSASVTFETRTDSQAALSLANPIPVITSVDAGNVSRNPNAPANTVINQPVVITGANFSSNAIALVNPPCDSVGFRKAASTVINSSTQIIATIQISCAGTYLLEVENPQPNGGLSAPVSFVIE